MRADETTSSRILWLAILSAAIAFTGPDTLAGPSAKEQEIAALKQRVVELQQRATVAEVDSKRLKREIDRLRAELEEARKTAERCSKPEPTEVEPTSPETIGLDHEIEESDLEVPPVVVAEPIADEAAPEPAASPTEISGESGSAELSEAPVTTATPPTADAQELYDEGYALFHQKRYSDAEERFHRYLELYPQTDLADNALFWIGESRYARGEFSSALEAFSGTVERFPHSNKVSDALLKAGKCLESLGDPQQAKRTYEEVVGRYPESAAAAQAHERLAELR